MGLAITSARDDPAEAVAKVAAARRGRLLRVHRRRLRFEDLEDCYSQATLELMARSRRAPFVSEDHVANALELRFKSRIEDRRRAIGGRSPIEAALARAVSVDAAPGGSAELEDRAAAVEQQVLARTELRRLREVIGDLSRDQQLVLASQVLVDMDAAEFCARHGWSLEKYRKVAQRARGKLRALIDAYERGERCRELEPDLLALSAGVAEGASLARVRAHLANCPTCTRTLADLERSARSVAALLPVGAAAGMGGRLAGAWSALRRMLTAARHPLLEGGAASGGAGVTGGSMASAGALKVGIVAVCAASAAGGYATCSHLVALPLLGVPAAHHAPPRRHAVTRHEIAHARKSAHRVDGANPSAAAALDSTTVSSTATTAPMESVPPVPRVVHHHRHARRMSTVAQIRLEFGSPPAHAAATTAAAPAPPEAPAPATSSAEPPPPAQSAAEASQTQAEFGFER